MQWKLKQGKLWLQRRNIEKVLEGNEHIICLFSCTATMVEKKTAMIREAVRKMEKNLVIIIVEFFSGLC